MNSPELFSSVFHFPAGISIDAIEPSANELVIGVACEAPSMPCPECQQPSCRIHSRYQRTVADVPCAGRNVLLALTVRNSCVGRQPAHARFSPSVFPGWYSPMRG